MDTTETITTKLGDTVSGAQDRMKSAFEKTSGRKVVSGPNFLGQIAEAKKKKLGA